MKKLIVIETPAELLKFANQKRKERTDGRRLPFLGTEAQLFIVFAENRARLAGAPGFVLSDEIRAQDILDEIGLTVGFKIFIR